MSRLWTLAFGCALFLGPVGCRKELDHSAGPIASAKPSAGHEESAAPVAPLDALKTRTYALAVEGNVVHAGTEAGVVSYDFTDPAHPKELATLMLRDSVMNLRLYAPNRLAVSAGPTGFALVDTSQVAAGKLAFLNHYPLPESNKKGCSSVWNVVPGADGRFGYVACGSGGLGRQEFQWPYQYLWTPRLTSGEEKLPAGFFVRDLAVIEKDPKGKKYPGPRLVLAAGKAGLWVVKLEAEASVLAKVPTEGDSRAIVMDGALAYVADGPGGLWMVDFSDPSHPVSKGRFNPQRTDIARGLGLGEKTLYLCLGESGLMALDISDPLTPKPAGEFDPERAINRVTVSANRLYVANDADGLVVLDRAGLKQIYPLPSAH